MLPVFKKMAVVALLTLVLESCYSYRQIRQQGFISEQSNHRGAMPLTVYVVNSEELPYEYSILKKAGLYTFASDSVCDQKIQLLPLEQYPVFMCLTASLPVTVLTLGQLPIRFEKKYAFHYYLVNDSITTKKEYELSINRQVWFWDMFTFKKSRRNALAGNLYNIAGN